MTIHFICKGNAYRSRLAEAYLKSKKLKGIDVISSGIEEAVYRDENIPIHWITQRLLQNQAINPFMSFNEKQTTKEFLDKSDLQIFFSKKYLDNCKKVFGFNSSNYEIWEIKDIDDYGLTKNNILRDEEMRKIDISEKTFEKIKNKVDDLVKRLHLR